MGERVQDESLINAGTVDQGKENQETESELHLDCKGKETHIRHDVNLKLAITFTRLQQRWRGAMRNANPIKGTRYFIEQATISALL